MAKILPPKTGEYPFYYEGYINATPENDLLTALKNNTTEMLNFFRENQNSDWSFRYETEKWSPREVMLHIIDTERIMTYRALCSSRGDRTHLPGFDQKGYVENSNADKRSLASLLAEFRSVRNASISLFRNMKRKEADRTGYANAQNITARALGYIIPGHARHHIAVLKEKYGFV